MLHMPCRILVPWLGTETVSPSVDVWSPNRWMTRAFPNLHILMICFQVHWLFSLTFLFCYWSHPVSFKIFSYCTFNYKFLFGFCVSLLFLWWDFLFFIYFKRKCWLLRHVLIAALKSLSDYSNITVILVLSFLDSFPLWGRNVLIFYLPSYSGLYPRSFEYCVMRLWVLLRSVGSVERSVWRSASLAWSRLQSLLPQLLWVLIHRQFCLQVFCGAVLTCAPTAASSGQAGTCAAVCPVLNMFDLLSSIIARASSSGVSLTALHTPLAGAIFLISSLFGISELLAV